MQPGSEAESADRGAPALSVRHLSKRFGDRIAFEDLCFRAERGEVFGFLGPNGAGKTTTVRTLGTLLAPTSGSATVAGLRLAPANGARIRRRIAIMPESPGLYLRLSALENLRCFADLYGIPDPAGRTRGPRADRRAAPTRRHRLPDHAPPRGGRAIVRPGRDPEHDVAHDRPARRTA
ncbi:ATP-binding cassette domain-containing protein [Planobispora takensis]|uniref:ABC transporter domain-containing protein n=1 Tax=Planobispora takensis TaxID=1367882 RepID=A0A8J3WW17_9ACTN|nr:hypothetical protein Pta02_53160 [Planobispora takensis]